VRGRRPRSRIVLLLLSTGKAAARQAMTRNYRDSPAGGAQLDRANMRKLREAQCRESGAARKNIKTGVQANTGGKA